jgi:hypothetical protein
MRLQEMRQRGQNAIKHSRELYRFGGDWMRKSFILSLRESGRATAEPIVQQAVETLVMSLDMQLQREKSLPIVQQAVEISSDNPSRRCNSAWV